MQVDEAASRLRKDLLCVSCQRAYSNRKSHGISVACKFDTPEGDNKWLHCSGCKVDHLSTVFTDEEAMKPWNKRLCIGRQGYVRLCEHEVITLADIETCMTQAWKMPTGKSWELMRRCNIPNPGLERRLNRDMGCHRHQASISISKPSESPNRSVLLMLQWLVDLNPMITPGMKPSELLSAKEMRAIAQALRLGGAASIIPSEGPSHLPEMDCFAASWDCNPLRRNLRVSAGQTTSRSGTRLPPGDRCASQHAVMDGSCTGQHSTTGFLTLLSSVSISTTRGLPLVSESDLFFQYKKIIKVDADMDTVYGTDGVTLRPSHEWYHAMDRNSYSWQGGCGALESCENQACRNYYNLTAVSRHYWRPDISRNCGCEMESVDG